MKYCDEGLGGIGATSLLRADYLVLLYGNDLVTK